MIDPTFGQFAGLPAMRRFAEETGGWPEETEDWQWCARFAYQVIERRGTGGGNFRLMYSRFLEEAGHEEGAELAAAGGGRLEGAGARRSARPASERSPSRTRGAGSAS